MNRRAAFLLMLMVPVLWSAAGIFTRQLDGLASVDIVFWRSAFTAVTVGLYLRVRNRATLTSQFTSMGLQGLLSSVMWAVIFTCFMLSLTLTTVANTLMVGSITPLLTAFFAWLFLRQRTPWRTWLAMAGTFAGLLWIFAGNIKGLHDANLAGLLFALAVPFAYAANYMLLQKAAARLDMMPAICLGAVISSIAMLPLAWPLDVTASELSILFLLGCFQLGLPCILLVMASRALLPAEMALLAMFELVLGPLWVWIGVSEIPSRETLAGGTVVFLCLFLHELLSMKHLRRPPGISKNNQ